MRFSFKLKNKEVLRDSAYSLGAKTIAMVFFLITDVLLARFCGRKLYGEWSFSYSLITMSFWIISFGINVSARVHIAKERLKENSYIYSYKAAMFLRFIISTIILLVFVLGVFNIAPILGYPYKYEYLQPLLLLGVTQSFFYSWIEFFKETFIGIGRVKGLAIITVVEYMGYMILGAGLLIITNNVIYLGLGFLISDIVACIFGLLYLFIVTNGYKGWSTIRLDWHVVKEIFIYALPILLINIGALILIEMDSVMLGIYYDDGINGIYSIAKSLISKMTQINFAISSVVMTSFAVIKENEVKTKKQLYRRINNINIICSIMLAIVAFVIAPFVIELLYGKVYDESFEIFRILLSYYLMYSITLFSGALLDYQKKASKRVVAYMMMVMLNLLLNYMFIPRYGGKGAAIATSISMVPYAIILEIMAYLIFKKKVK